VAVRAPSLPRPLDLKASRLEVTSNASGMLDLCLEGAVNGEPLALAGVVGPIGGAAPAAGAENHLEGHLGNVAISLRATVELPSLLVPSCGGIHGPASESGPSVPSLGDGGRGAAHALDRGAQCRCRAAPAGVAGRPAPSTRSGSR
jgi:hypothetical protein